MGSENRMQHPIQADIRADSKALVPYRMPCRRAEKGREIAGGMGEGGAVEKHPAQYDERERIDVLNHTRRAFQRFQEKKLFKDRISAK